MPSLFSRLVSPPARRSFWPPETVNVGGLTYPLLPTYPSPLSFKQEEIAPGYVGFATQAMMANPIVFACMEYRRKTFAQARFQWQRLANSSAGPAGSYFGTSELGILELPWQNATTEDLLDVMIQHADLGGNAFAVRRGETITLLRPDWVSIVAASRGDPDQGSAAIDAELMGYAYWPGGKGSGNEPEILLPEDVAHFAPTKDPTAHWRGMSWLAPTIRDIMGDAAASTHKLKYFESGASGAVVVKMDPTIVNTPEKFDAWVEKLEQGHGGVSNAYKRWYLSAATDVTTVGDNLRQQDFAVTTGKGESRIASAAGVPPILVGFSEGLAAATYSNYGMARRSYIDATLMDLWNHAAAALQSILTIPGASRLAVDTRRIPLLQEDEKDRAEIQQLDAGAIRSLIDGGFVPDAVVDAVTAGDLARLKGNHTGYFSVQLNPPSDGTEPADAVASARAALRKVGIARPTDEQVAEHLGVSDRTIRRWKRRSRD